MNSDIIDQCEIDALVASANLLAAETEQELNGMASGPPQREAIRRTPARAPTPRELREFRRILRISVPVIANLAERNLALKEVLGWTPGSIIEFDQPADADLDLVVGNRRIGIGQAVKVGENFGIRITEIGDLVDRIRALGP